MKNITYQKILVTHDGSKFSWATFPHAKSLALMYHAELVLLHVVEPNQSLVMGAEASASIVALAASKKATKQEIQKARRQLTKIKAEFEAEGVIKVITKIEEGSAEDVITTIAKTQKCDLIVMCTHGRSGIARVFLGSVTDYVIRHAHCPVLSIHPVMPKRRIPTKKSDRS